MGQDHVHLGAHHVEELVQVVDEKFFKRLKPADIGHHTDQAFVIGQALTQDPPAAVLEHRHLDRRVDEQALRSIPRPAVTGLHLPGFEKEAVFAGQAHLFAADVDQPRDQPGNAGGVLGAGDAHHRDATVVVGFKQMLDDGFANGSCLAACGLQMGQQAGAGIDLNHSAALPG